MFGNLLSWGILYGGASTITTNETTVRDISVCGKNDCQDPNTTAENISQYEPATEATLYAMLGAMAFLCLLGMLISMIFVPELDTSKEHSSNETPVATISSADLNKEIKEPNNSEMRRNGEKSKKQVN